MKDLRVIKVKPISYGKIEVIWEDNHIELIDISEHLKKPMFNKINKDNFNSIDVLYDGCTVGWLEFDVEIGLTRWVEVNKKEVA